MNRKIKFRAWWKEWDSMYFFDIYNVPNLPVEANIMQFTGLLDRHGKEIYEGDIVDHRGIRWKVWFRNQSWFPYNLDEMNVIGNIHENPDLLTQKP